MIKDALAQDKEAIFKVWEQYYPLVNHQDLHHFYNHVYDQGKAVILEQDSRIVSTVYSLEHVLAMKKKRLLVNYLSGLLTIPDYRMRGYMDALMENVLDESSHAYLFTLIHAFHPQFYERFGFEVVGVQKQYRIASSAFQTIVCDGVSRSYTAKELLTLYERFTAHFDGFMIRSMGYYEQLIERTLNSDLQLCVYRNQADELIGYICYIESEQEVIVKEVIYLDSAALSKMLKYAIQNKPTIQVQVSIAEKLEKIFPMAIIRKVPFLMAKLHQKELFNKLYNVNIHTASEAFQLLDKPMFNNETY